MDKILVIQNKLFDSSTLQKQLELWRFFGKKIVFTNGCFDLLHLGHIDYLAKAAAMGNILIVGLNTDASVSKLKGPARPINDEHSRLFVMASLFFVNAVILFDEPTPIKLIRQIEPDVLVKGGDYKVEEIVGYDVVIEKGGEIITIPLVDGYSTTAIESKIRNSAR